MTEPSTTPAPPAPAPSAQAASAAPGPAAAGAATPGPEDPLARPANAGRLAALLEAGALDERGYSWALAAIGRRPNAAAWRRFLLVHLTFLGVAALAGGAGFFVAASWARLGTAVKLGLVAGPMALLSLAAARAGFDRLAGRAAALLAALLAGPLLALLGKSYPTGADAYDLLVAWSAVNALFAAATREPALLALELLLLDATLAAWLGEVRGRDLWRDEGLAFLLGVSALHAAAAAGWEALHARGVPGFSGRAFPRLASAVALGVAVAVATPFIVDDGARNRASGVVACALSVAGVAALVAAHSSRIPDLAQLAIAGAAGATLLSILAGRILYDGIGFGVGTLFLHGAAVTGQMTLLAYWLLDARRRHRAPRAQGAP